MLLAAGANPNFANPNTGETPLLAASFMGSQACVQMLIDARVDVNTANQYGETPAWLAARWGNPECLQMLIRIGADVTTPANDGTTPLRIAERYGNQECADMINQRLNPRYNRPTKSATFNKVIMKSVE